VSPTIARIGPYRFFFFANEGAEPPHVHVQRERMLAKFWLDPVGLASSTSFGAHELNTIRRTVEENAAAFREAWNEFFGS
jgi:hypothetical protein